MYSVNNFWIDLIISVVFAFIIFPMWIYIVCKMAGMGFFEGFHHSINKYKGVKNGRSTNQ